jgi:hypothetical protein
MHRVILEMVFIEFLVLSYDDKRITTVEWIVQYNIEYGEQIDKITTVEWIMQYNNIRVETD